MYKCLHGALLLAFTASRTFALYEEQAGENDWHSEYVGRATDIQPSGQDRLVVSTTSNVLATHSVASGDVLWRQVLHPSDQLQSFTLLSKPAAIVSLSNSSSVLRAWRSHDGTLLWEKRIQPSAQTLHVTLSNVPETTLGAGEGIAIVAAGHVQVKPIRYCISKTEKCSHACSGRTCTRCARCIASDVLAVKLT